ncbi:hypothetical protein [Streptomyces sp. M2CJ-2]|uniref:hypothetical protein n=1 Tax=Streptomyces sp. M2CJ-2 TaxID=2803948 RepID=UPI0019253211|nr:hypothetical protein [Streptomyces sp. M2CJ-2]
MTLKVAVRTCTAPSATLNKGLWYSSDATVIYDTEDGGQGCPGVEADRFAAPALTTHRGPEYFHS